FLIIEDPQVGVFCVLGLLFICVFKLLFIYEIISISDSSIYIYIVFIPFFSRLFTGLGLLLINPAKKTGLGYLFHSSDQDILKYYLGYIIPIIIILGIYNLNYMFTFTIILGLKIGRASCRERV